MRALAKSFPLRKSSVKSFLTLSNLRLTFWTRHSTKVRLELDKSDRGRREALEAAAASAPPATGGKDTFRYF